MSIVADKLYTREEFLSLPGLGWGTSTLMVISWSGNVERVYPAMWPFESRLGSSSNPSGRTKPVSMAAILTYDCFQAEGSRMRRADVSLVRKSRLEGLGDIGIMLIPADLVVEVLSLNDEVLRRELESPSLSHCRFLGWSGPVDPNAKIVFIHRRDGFCQQSSLNPTKSLAKPPLPSFRCKVAEFFGT